jgi:hypothetical protein
MFRDKSIVSHHVETHLGKKQERSMLIVMTIEFCQSS